MIDVVLRVLLWPSAMEKTSWHQWNGRAATRRQEAGIIAYCNSASFRGAQYANVSFPQIMCVSWQNRVKWTPNQDFAATGVTMLVGYAFCSW